MLDISGTTTRRQLRRTCALARPHRERNTICVCQEIKKIYWEILSSVEDMHSYCIRCRRATDTLQATRVLSKNGRRLVKGKCRTCGVSKTRFVRGSVQKGGDIVDSLNKVTGRVKLPWAKFRGEMHLPGHNFTGPGTNLNKRLNPDGTPKSWSRPVDRVNRAAFHHDLAYAKYKDKAKRLAADKKMIRELDNINNPTLREQMERVVVRPLIAAKANFGV